jgi:hypothetical protein
LIVRKHDPVRAKAALLESDKYEVAEMGRMFRSRVRGAIALAEGDLAAAKKHLEQSLAEGGKFKNALLMTGNLKLTQALLCITEGKLGNRAAAQALYADVKPLLTAKGEDDLLRQCEAAIA